MSKTIDLGRVVGNSAYEDAVANGYVGTLEQWLASLKGEKGERGEQGIQGIQGERGLQGVAGQDGQNGADGQDGQDGYSPTVSLFKSGKTTTLVITDKNGEHTATILDGNDGQNGQDGRDGTNGTNGTNGQDGVSPAVSIETIQGGHQVTITDAGHPQGQSFNVMDGQDAPAVTEIFWATYGTTTAAEIQAALDAGKVVMCKYNNNIYSSICSTSSTIYFGCIRSDAIFYLTLGIASSNWGNGNRAIILPISQTPSSNYSTANTPSSLTFRDVIAGISGGLEELTGWSTKTYYDMSGSTVPTTVTTTTSPWQGLIAECNAGDVFLVTGQGGNAPRSVGFADADRNILFVAPANTNIVNTLYVAPNNAKYIVLARTGTEQNSYRVISAKEKAEAVDAKIGSAVSLTFIYEDDTTQTYNLLTAPSNL